jgi:integrase
MKRLLTDAKVKASKPTGKAYKVTDGGGLYLYVTSAGGKSWRYDYKINNKRATITLGLYPEVSLSEARDSHDSARTEVSKGIDPRQAKAESNLIAKPFSYYAIEAMKTQELKPATEQKKLSRMKKHLFPVLDKTLVTEITAIDLFTLLKPIADSGTRETAQLLVTYCRQTFDSLLAMQLITSNPAESISRLLPKPKQSTNFAHITDPKEFASLLNGIDGFSGEFAVKKALQFLPLVMLRPHNIRFLRWDYIDFESKVITIPAEEMKMKRPHKIPLAKQSLAILSDMKALTGNKELVFITDRSRNNKAMSENTLNNALARVKDSNTGKALGKGLMTSHGFRHSASTFLNEMGFSADAIELQLAHASADRIRATYNKAELMPERIKMMQSWADYLDGLKSGGDIIPLKRKA